MPHQIDLATLDQRLTANPALVLLEALPERYYRDGHLPGALHLPLDRVRELAQALVPDRHAEVVVYCASATCRNSHQAAAVLTQMGYTRVAVYGGGKQEWVESGRTLEHAAEAVGL